MVLEFNDFDDIRKYYDIITNTFIFKENGFYISLVIFNFNLNIKANIEAWNIKALNITAKNIKAWDIRAIDIKALDITAEDINANNITAENINYYAVCFAYESIKCKSIKGRKKNAKHFVFDGTLEVEE